MSKFCFRLTLILVGIISAYIINLNINLPEYPVENLVIKQNRRSQKPYKIVMPLPEVGFDPTEASIPWNLITQNKDFKVIFATKSGKPSKGADPELLSSNINSLAFGPPQNVKDLLQKMTQSQEYLNPLKWSELNAKDFSAIFVVGGHNPNMKELIESEILKKLLLQFKEQKKVISAICHGSLLLTRTANLLNKSDQITSVPAYLENLAHYLTKYVFQMGGYQLSTTYNQYTQEEMEQKGFNFVRGPFDLLAPLIPTSEGNYKHGFLVEDGQFLTSRFWGDAHLFGKRLMAKVSEQIL